MTDNPPPLEDNQLALTVDSIVVAPAASVTGEFYQIETQKIELDRLRLENNALSVNTGHRDRWARKLFPLCAGWLVAVVAVLMLEGFHSWGFHLDNSVLIAFIGTTTADVLGLGYIVVNYLFPKPS
jgi:hypothetical protein